MKKTNGFKKVLSILLCLVMVMSVAGCSSSSAAEPTAPEAVVEETLFTPGTYTGTAAGINGDITMEVVVDGNAITAINAIEHKESPGISDAAFEEIPQAIIDGQTLAVDMVAGATFSSEGIFEAVTLALTEAGADIEALSYKEEVADDETGASKEVVEYETEVLVVGAGGAGLAAAVSAHQNGANVIVLEKMPKMGGNTIMSGSAFNCVDPSRQEPLGIEDSIDLHFQQTYEGGDEEGNPVMIRTLVENGYPTLQWLESMGMEFKDHVFTVLGGMWPRAHKPVMPLGTGYIDTYERYINEHSEDIQVLLNADVFEIMMEDGRVIGVKADGKEKEIIVHASKGVVMATGGFGANVEMRVAYNTIWNDLSTLNTTNHPGATGDGIVMAEEIGANLVGMEAIQLLPMGDPKTGSLLGNIEQGVENRIFVNDQGNRFVNEGARRDVMTAALLEQSDTHMWIVLDKHSYPDGQTRNNFNEVIDDLVEAGRAYQADTLEDLAAQIGVDPASLVAAADSFNAGVENGTDEFGRTLYDQKIDTPPFYAGARVPTVHHTMGGILIDTETRVLDADGNVIPGFYAAGEVTGGIHGANRLGGNALVDIAVFGKIAGESVALEK